jgi:hypothetical protein
MDRIGCSRLKKGQIKCPIDLGVKSVCKKNACMEKAEADSASLGVRLTGGISYDQSQRQPLD